MFTSLKIAILLLGFHTLTAVDVDSRLSSLESKLETLEAINDQLNDRLSNVARRLNYLTGKLP